MDFNIIIEKMESLNKLRDIYLLHKESSEPNDFMLIQYYEDYIIRRKEVSHYVHGNIIGLKVKKKSNRPFKSKLKENTIKTVTFNVESGKIGFRFNEDDSVVDVSQCVTVK